MTADRPRSHGLTAMTDFTTQEDTSTVLVIFMNYKNSIDRKSMITYYIIWKSPSMVEGVISLEADSRASDTI